MNTLIAWLLRLAYCAYYKKWQRNRTPVNKTMKLIAYDNWLFFHFGETAQRERNGGEPWY